MSNGSQGKTPTTDEPVEGNLTGDVPEMPEITPIPDDIQPEVRDGIDNDADGEVDEGT